VKLSQDRYWRQFGFKLGNTRISNTRPTATANSVTFSKHTVQKFLVRGGSGKGMSREGKIEFWRSSEPRNSTAVRSQALTRYRARGTLGGGSDQMTIGERVLAFTG